MTRLVLLSAIIVRNTVVYCMSASTQYSDILVLLCTFLYCYMCITPETCDIHVHVHVYICMLVYTVPVRILEDAISLTWTGGALPTNIYMYIHIVNGILISGSPITIEEGHFAVTILNVHMSFMMETVLYYYIYVAVCVHEC